MTEGNFRGVEEFQREMAEVELKAMLIERIGRKNYVVSLSVRQEIFEKAIFREFKKFLGEKVEGEKRSGFLEVIIRRAWLFFLQQIRAEMS